MFEKYEDAKITIEQLADIHPSLYRLCDVRDEISYTAMVLSRERSVWKIS